MLCPEVTLNNLITMKKSNQNLANENKIQKFENLQLKTEDLKKVKGGVIIEEIGNF